MEHIAIAIDGPAGAGKSTYAKAIAKRLNMLYIDTGAMYRAMALKAVRNGLDPKNEEDVLTIIDETQISLCHCEDGQRVMLDGEDVTELIRTPIISQGASDISAIPAVRLKLVKLQREIAEQNDVIMDGRDIGSYVLPDARYKFYITASSNERARRRLKELKAKSLVTDDVDVDTVEADIKQRDYNDSNRSLAPLKQVPDAILIDTTDMDIECAIDSIIKHLNL